MYDTFEDKDMYRKPTKIIVLALITGVIICIFVFTVKGDKISIDEESEVTSMNVSTNPNAE